MKTHTAKGFNKPLTDFKYLEEGEAIRVPYLLDTLREAGVNYLAWNNNPESKNHYENKWMFFYVPDMAYINEQVTELSVTEDIITTWGIEAHIDSQYGFIERWTAPTDEPGDNKEAEPHELGEYVVTGRTKLKLYDNDFDPEVVVVTLDDFELVEESTAVWTCTWNQSSSCPQINWMTPSALKFTTLGTITASASTDCDIILKMKAIIDSATSTYAGSTDVIQGFYVRPKICGDTHSTQTGFRNTGNDITYTKPNPMTRNLDGYTPRNKKMTIFPYCSMVVTNNQGSSVQFYPERWYDANNKPTNTCRFKLFAGGGTTGTAMLTPTGYTTYSNVGNDMSISLKCITTCSWASDTYKAYIAQKQAKSWFNAFVDDSPILGGIVKFAAPFLGIDTDALTYGDSSSIISAGGSAFLSSKFSSAVSEKVGSYIDKGEQKAASRAFEKAEDTLEGFAKLEGKLDRFNKLKKVGKTASGILGGSFLPGLAVELAGQVYNSAVHAGMNYNYKLPDTINNIMDVDCMFDYSMDNEHSMGGFYMHELSIPAWNAKEIDDFLSRWGYALNKHTWYSTRRRKYFTYLKVSDMQIKNVNIPLNVILGIRTIMGNGTTFWRVDDNGNVVVGDANIGITNIDNPCINNAGVEIVYVQDGD